MKKYPLIITLIVLSFISGFIIKSLLTDNTSQQHKAEKITPEPLKQAKAPVDDAQLSSSAQKKYYILLAEYLRYTKQQDQSPPISFDEFLVIRRDRLVQENKYTPQDESLDNEIISWYNKGGDQKQQEEETTYLINGTISGPSQSYRNNSDVLVATYLNPTQNLLPTIPYGHIMPEVSTYYSYLHKNTNNFEFNINLPETEEGESLPVYLSALIIPRNVPYNTQPMMVGTDKDVDGVPASMLSRREKNDPIQIKLRANQKRQDQSNLTINNVYENTMVSIYGVDLISKLYDGSKISRSAVASLDEVIRLRSMPAGSSVLVISNTVDPEDRIEKDFCFETTINNNDATITLPQKTRCAIDDSCLLIIKPYNMHTAEISVYSKDPKFRKSKIMGDQDNWFIENVNFKEGILELKINNESFGLMKIEPIKNKTLIIEPGYKTINLFSGNIKKINSSSTSPVACSKCRVSVRFSEKESHCGENGTFNINDLKTIDNSLNINVDGDDVATTINILSMYPQKELILNSNIPSKTVLKEWSLYAPTTPGKSVVYGEFPYYKGYKSFLIGVDNQVIKEAIYFNKSNLPDKKMYSTSYMSTDHNFGKFVFNDVSNGKYVLHLISGDKIIHSRIVYVENGRTLVIN